MIVDTLATSPRWSTLHELFPAAFEFLSKTDFENLPDGKHEIHGERLFVIVASDQGKGRENAMLEFHRNYIDIQYIINGADEIGWLAACDCRRISTEYDRSKDLGFFFDRPKTWLYVPSNSFAIFYPEDAHAPLGCNGAVRKAVVKVAV